MASRIFLVGLVVAVAACASGGRMQTRTQSAPARTPAAPAVLPLQPEMSPWSPATSPSRPVRVDHARGSLNATLA